MQHGEGQAYRDYRNLPEEKRCSNTTTVPKDSTSRLTDLPLRDSNSLPPMSFTAEGFSSQWELNSLAGWVLSIPLIVAPASIVFLYAVDILCDLLVGKSTGISRRVGKPCADPSRVIVLAWSSA